MIMQFRFLLSIILAIGFSCNFSQLKAQYFVHFGISQADTLVAIAGGNQTVTAGTQVVLGGNPAATGGTVPYTYAWSPAWGLSSPVQPNPTMLADSSLTYVLAVTDSLHCTAQDLVQISVLAPVAEIHPLSVKWNVYPNPAGSGMLFIHAQAPLTSNTELLIHHISGKLVHQAILKETLNAIDLSASALSPGLYWLTIRDTAEYHCKLIVR